MITYKQPRKGLFDGYITQKNGHTVSAIIEKAIIGETSDEYITRFQTCKYEETDWEENTRYQVSHTDAIGIHKSRLIRWTLFPPTQLTLFSNT